MDDYDEEAPEPEPIVRIPQAPGDLQVGDYVFACRWSDADPGDPWTVGFVSEVGECYVVLAGGPRSYRRFPKAMAITAEQGARIVKEYPPLEHRPMDYEVIARIFGVPTNGS